MTFASHTIAITRITTSGCCGEGGRVEAITSSDWFRDMARPPILELLRRDASCSSGTQARLPAACCSRGGRIAARAYRSRCNGSQTVGATDRRERLLLLRLPPSAHRCEHSTRIAWSLSASTRRGSKESPCGERGRSDRNEGNGDSRSLLLFGELVGPKLVAGDFPAIGAYFPNHLQHTVSGDAEFQPTAYGPIRA